jgi:hypothetical protein
MESEKPNLRNKGSRFGIKTNNTIKYKRFEEKRELSHISTVGVYPLDNSQQNHGYLHYTGEQPFSINKDKRWETIEDMKKDPNYVVVENIQHKYVKQNSWKDTYKSNEPSSDEEEEEGEFTLVKGRKGKQIKQKRTPGKKGIKKHELEKPKLEAEFIIEVSNAPTKKDGLMFRTEESGYHSPDWNLGIEKNNQKKKRKRVKDQCNL